jgi:hypothetical protein
MDEQHSNPLLDKQQVKEMVGMDAEYVMERLQVLEQLEPPYDMEQFEAVMRRLGRYLSHTWQKDPIPPSLIDNYAAQTISRVIEQLKQVQPITLTDKCYILTQGWDQTILSITVGQVVQFPEAHRRALELFA